MGKLWGFRSETFRTWTEGFTSKAKAESKPAEKPVHPVFTLSHITHGLLILAGKFYLAVVLVYLVWNTILSEKISGVKPLSVSEAMWLTVIINYIRTPKPPLLASLKTLFTEEQ